MRRERTKPAKKIGKPRSTIVKYKSFLVQQNFENQFQSKLQDFVDSTDKERTELNLTYANMLQKAKLKTEDDKQEPGEISRTSDDGNSNDGLDGTEIGMESLKLDNLFKRLDRERVELKKFDERIFKSMNNI
jgi:hypothetical protein